MAGSPVCTRCPALAMYMQQRWEVVAGLDTAWWSRMAGSAAVGGSSEEVEEKGPLRPGTGRVCCDLPCCSTTRKLCVADLSLGVVYPVSALAILF